MTERKTDLESLYATKESGTPIVMLTAYDYPTARIAAAAGVDMLLVGDSLGNVILGLETTRDVPIDLIITLAAAVRRGAPQPYLVGDMPFAAMADVETAVKTAERFVAEAGCDAVKIETSDADRDLVASLADRGIDVIAHLGLRPQQVTRPDQYRAQARTLDEIEALVASSRMLVAAGAKMVLLEAVPNEASQAVVAAVDVPVIGCGAGAACDGHVVVTHDMLGITFGPVPRFVPTLADVKSEMRRGIDAFVAAVRDGSYPAAEHGYPMRKTKPQPDPQRS